MLDFLAAARQPVIDAIEASLQSRKRLLAFASRDHGTDAPSRLAAFATRGKLIRGCLVRLGRDLVGGQGAASVSDAAVAEAGAAMELFQSGLLVHDDIMDRDRVRRGAPTVHAAYEADLERGAYADPAHGGESLAICLGDVAYFVAFELLAGLDVPADVCRRALALAGRELALVATAQMQDVSDGAAGPSSISPFASAMAEPDEASILAMYRCKTGRYTFSMPLALGAMLAGAPTAHVEILERVGESLGVLFQLKDDELGLFAAAATLGKPIGSDIRENKKTLFRSRLLSLAEPAEHHRLLNIFGNAGASDGDIAFVLSLMDRIGIRPGLDVMMTEYAELARRDAAPVLSVAPPLARAAFLELVDYSLSRSA